MRTKKYLLIIVLLIISFILTGCWNYVGLDHMTIVTGFAVDRTSNNKGYHTTFEIVDMIKSNKNEGIKTEIIESEGTTIFEAIRNAKKRITNKLYFANAQIIIINEDIAKKEGIEGLANWFLRDAEVRETIKVIIAKDSSAKDVINVKGLGNVITSYEIAEIVDRDKKITSSTIDAQMYQVYNILNGHGIALSLPVIHIVNNDDKKAVEADGVAVFDKDKLVGYLNSSETLPFLLATGKSQGGIITTDKINNKDKVSLEISKASSKYSFTYNKDKLKFNIKMELKVYLGEDMVQTEKLTEKQIDEISKQASIQINKEVKIVINKIQKEFNTDILGFGQYIYRHNPGLYTKLEKDWKKLFKDIDIQVDSKIEIVNTAFMQ
jgi:spore germination protein KC